MKLKPIFLIPNNVNNAYYIIDMHIIEKIYSKLYILHIDDNDIFNYYEF